MTCCHRWRCFCQRVNFSRWLRSPKTIRQNYWAAERCRTELESGFKDGLGMPWCAYVHGEDISRAWWCIEIWEKYDWIGVGLQNPSSKSHRFQDPNIDPLSSPSVTAGASKSCVRFASPGVHSSGKMATDGALIKCDARKVSVQAVWFKVTCTVSSI